MTKNLSRRKFVKGLIVHSLTAPLYFSTSSLNALRLTEDLDIHIFSKHLQFLSFRDAGEIAAEMGFAGIDLTVRPKGHVWPASVSDVLPEAIKEIEQGGSKCKMITTNIERVDNPIDRAILTTASEVGIQYYRTNWFKYHEGYTMPESLTFWQNEIRRLGEFNKSLKITGCYQNHAGTKIGASYWEINALLKTVNPTYFGTQYDIRHAIAEGAFSWENGLMLLKDHIKTIVLKDFKWGKVAGKWKALNVPIGHGMVDFTKYFRLLKKLQINVPVSLHLEYPLGGAEKGKSKITIDKKEVFGAMVRDLKTIQKLWREA